MSDEPGESSPPQAIATFSWKSKAVFGVALVALFSGFGQYGVVAALGSVARHFGHVTGGTTVAEQAGLSGTSLGAGLAILRLGSLGGLPIATLADRLGRRSVLLASCAIGLVISVVAAWGPTYWSFVAIYALSRPLLSSTNSLASVMVAEQTNSAERAKAVGLVAAGYGAGAGLIAVCHGLATGLLGFRGVFLLAILPLMALPFVSRWVKESDRYAAVRLTEGDRLPTFGYIPRQYRARLVVVVGIAFSVAVITGPANSFVFIYAQNVLHISGTATSIMVAFNAILGILGLVLGQHLADRIGRRWTTWIGICGAGVAATFCYSGSHPALFIGFSCGVLSGATFAPAAGALANELFPTIIRASINGWTTAASVLGAVVGLVVFGTVADLGNRFATAGLATFLLPIIVAGVLLTKLPETKGLEPEQVPLGRPGRPVPHSAP